MRRKLVPVAMFCIVALLAVWLRVHDIRSDAYPRLSWSSALLTDEGFYMHNARNVVLYGKAQVDEFNNMLIMPWLHFLQVVAFREFGVGVVPDRWISIIASLLALPFFWFATVAAFGKRAAVIGTTLLALDHSWVLYNRLALMDTPGALVLIAAWACWEYARTGKGFQKSMGLFLCGTLLGFEYGVRGLGALVWPAPFLAIAVCSDRANVVQRLKSTWLIVVGLAVALMAYGVLWWRPYHLQLAKVDKYYIGHQLIPHSLRQLGFNFDSAWFYWENGLLGYLVKHLPVLLVVGSAWWLYGRKSTSSKMNSNRPSSIYLGWWVISFLVFFSFVNYAPSRYYVLMYPAMFALSAAALDKLLDNSSVPISSKTLLSVVVVTWISTNVYWYQDWLSHITYRQWRADAWLGANLPPNSVIFGDISNGLCMNNHLLPICVIHGLCNYHNPLALYRNRPEYVLILDGRWKERWWMTHYPGVVTDVNRIHVFKHVLRRSFVLGLYKVPTGPACNFVSKSSLTTHTIAR